MFARSPPASPVKGITETSAVWPFSPCTKKLPMRMADGVCSFQCGGTFQVISLELAAGAMLMLVSMDCMSCPGGLDPATGGADWPPPTIGALIIGIVGPVVSFDTRYVWIWSSFRQPAV